jgi:hypothetical protein
MLILSIFIFVQLIYNVANVKLKDTFYFCKETDHDPYVRLDTFQCVKNKTKLSQVYRKAFVLEKKLYPIVKKNVSQHGILFRVSSQKIISLHYNLT